MRAVVAIEPQRFKQYAANATQFGLQEQADVGLAKTINRLHRVADDKQRASIARLPTRRQHGEQLYLRRTGVLKLIHQQMTDAVIELELQIARLVNATECQQRALRHLDEIHLALLLEHGPQLRGSELEQLREHTDDACFFRIQHRRRQLLDARERCFGARHAGERFNAGRERVLERFPLLARRYALPDVQCLAPFAFISEQQSRNATPQRELRQVACQWRIPIGQRGD